MCVIGLVQATDGSHDVKRWRVQCHDLHIAVVLLIYLHNVPCSKNQANSAIAGLNNNALLLQVAV